MSFYHVLIVPTYIHAMTMSIEHPTNVATFNFIRFTIQIENFCHRRPKVREFKYG